MTGCCEFRLGDRWTSHVVRVPLLLPEGFESVLHDELAFAGISGVHPDDVDGQFVTDVE